jgi:hypothetical protein
MTHECRQEETIGKFKEFIDNYKGVKTTLFTVALAIILQVGGFLFLWGRIVEKVDAHEKSIDYLVKKLDKVQLIGVAEANDLK